MINFFQKRIIIFFALVIAIPLVVLSYYTVFAGDQSKTTELAIGANSGEILAGTQANFPFSTYIGDNLTGVTNPVKNASIIVTGIFDNAGSITLELDSNPATAKTFVLPVNTRHDFYFVYKDDTGVLNQAAAGSYSHTLNVISSVSDIWDFGSKLITTDQFAPTSCVDGAIANEKVKTNEFFVASDTGQLSVNSFPFTVYIGDNIASTTNAVKSVYFPISGVYAGSGTITLSITNSSGTGTSTIFTLPSASGYTSFNFVYGDIYKMINPTTAGSYSYTLNVSTNGVSIYNFVATVVETHRYKPVDCSAGYQPYGDLVSAVYDSTASADGAAYNSIMWKGQLGGPSFDQGKVKFQVATADATSGPWIYSGGSTCGSNDWYDASSSTPVELTCISQLNNKRYFRYKIRLCSSDCSLSGTYTPQVDDVILNWSP